MIVTVVPPAVEPIVGLRRETIGAGIVTAVTVRVIDVLFGLSIWKVAGPAVKVSPG